MDISGYSYETTYYGEIKCTKYFTSGTVAYTRANGDYITTHITEPRYPDIYPHTVYAAAIRFRNIVKQTDSSVAAVWTPTAREYGDIEAEISGGTYSVQVDEVKIGLAASTGIVVFIASLTVFALFFHFRRRRTGPRRVVGTHQTPLGHILRNRLFGWSYRSLQRFGWGLFFSIVLVFPVGIISCLFASQKEWQRLLVTWSRDTSAVLRALQVSAFLVRLLSASLARGIMCDIGWMIMHFGTSGTEMVTLLDMSTAGGSYPYVSEHIYH